MVLRTTLMAPEDSSRLESSLATSLAGHREDCPAASSSLIMLLLNAGKEGWVCVCVCVYECLCVAYQ